MEAYQVNEAQRQPLQAPFPWFGGKSRVAEIVWEHFGDCPNYVEPFFGSGAVLLARPSDPGTETINDKDGYVANFWRAIQAAPDEVAHWADWPVNENDLHARHSWLVNAKAEFVSRLEGDPDFYDAKIAGWWVWGICCWIGGGWCAAKGPWRVRDGKLVDAREEERSEEPGVRSQEEETGVNRQLVHLGNAGQGVNRQLVHLGDAGRGVNRKRPILGGHTDKGVHKPSAGDGAIYDWFRDLSARLRRVRVCSGDWTRVCGPTPTFGHGITGVFLDPPYADTAERDSNLYAEDSLSVAHDVRKWAIEAGENPLMRIALCGYEGEHDMPDDWECVAWKAAGGYGSQGAGENQNSARERIWFSPHCLTTPSLFSAFQMSNFKSEIVGPGLAPASLLTDQKAVASPGPTNDQG